ncbi:DnaT-like ssDNA-binding domain-containing protein [Pseudomonas sp. EA_35y_Pfl2_R111]|uniref:DnaT-like ssDNA-binding domain-containing protein n=1 Tax=Pseudomonas sp. EA_35y_Pfl2_R111 TaxID=3088689 RepID=UPI0030D96A03
MAGDWIKFELITLDKPEVCQLADLAGIDPDAVVGKLLRVWGWFDQHTEDGNAPSVSKRLLDRLVGVTGFCDSMIYVGWMVEVDGEEGHWIALPNFGRHNGETAKKRLLGAKRAASHKARGTAANAKSNAGSVSDALPREDKRREDQHNSTGASGSSGDGQGNPSAPSEMHLSWKPDPDQLKAYAFAAGIKLDAFTDDAIGLFTCHYTPSGRVETHATWVSLLVKWVKRDQTQNASGNVRPFPPRQGDRADWAEQEVIL